ncbi:MAG TPA: ATP-binding protein [Verrucomicrobiae bacterium]|nr:ATP-binding protein [Verrucomicrobiae bacterium]
MVGLNLLLVIAAVAANLFTGFFVLLFKPKSATNWTFFLLTSAAAFWTIANYLSLTQATSLDTLHFARWELGAGILYSFCVLLTVSTFPGNQLTIKPFSLVLLGLGTAAVIALTQTPYVFSSIVGTGTNVEVTPGTLIPVYGLANLGFLIASVYIIIRRAKAAHGARRTQLQYLMGAVGLSYVVAFITNFVFVNLLGITSLLPVAPYLSLLFVFITAYAIVAHHLFDIRLVIKRTVIFTALVAFSFVVYTAVIVLLSRLFQEEATSIRGYAINLAAAIAVGFSFEPMRNFISERTDKWLFKKEYEQQVVIRDLSKKLNDVIALDEALEIVMQTIVKVLHLKHAVTYVFQPAENNGFAVKRVKQVGYSSSAKLFLEDRDFTVSYFAEHPATALVRDMQLELEREEALSKKNGDGQAVRAHAIKQAVYQKLTSLDTAVAVPLHLNGQAIGLIMLSEKLNGESYSHEDLSLLEVVGGQAISSIQKAKLYEGDQMKSEFVSIASHELLTPISAIEGYLSMILDENIGQVDDKARDYLTKVYTSARRLSLLIKDLLSVSRIESGKMKIDPQQLDMNKMVNDTIDQLRFMAADKNLTISYNPPSECPPVWADPDRTMQVLVNLVSNSIKYTKQGGLTITLSIDKKAGYMTTAISDTGIGMSKANMQHLFTQFYRVDTPETTGIVGTGLGLYITKSIIEKMGGAITVKSEVGKGSTFSFILPLFKVETSTMV